MSEAPMWLIACCRARADQNTTKLMGPRLVRFSNLCFCIFVMIEAYSIWFGRFADALR